MKIYNECLKIFEETNIKISDNLKNTNDLLKYLKDNNIFSIQSNESYLSNEYFLAWSKLLKYKLLDSYKILISEKFINNANIPFEFVKEDLDIYFPFKNAVFMFEQKELNKLMVQLHKTDIVLNGTPVFNMTFLTIANNSIIPVNDIFFTYSKAPRIYILCSNASKCKYKSIADIGENTDFKGELYLPMGCRRTFRSIDVCNSSQLKAVFMDIQIIKRVLNLIKNKKNILSFDNKKSNKQVQTTNTEKYIYISSNNIHYRNYENNKINSDIRGSEKSQHIRREHLRHLKNGKVIKVKQTIVKEGHEKTNYKV